MNDDCTCGSQTLDHNHDCPDYQPPVLETREQYLERLALSQQITTERLRQRVVAYSNGSGRLRR